MKHNILSKVILSTAIVTGSVAAPFVISDHNQTHAAEKQEGIGKLSQKNESTLHLSVNKNIKGTVSSNGELTLSDGKETKQMPTNATDKNGNEVVLAYKKSGDGFDRQ
ncbi:Orf3, partial [human gut metagenome]